MRGSFFFFLTYNLYTAYSYNVKQLTCIILCSSGLQNINTSSKVEVFNIYNIYIGLQNFIYKIDLKVFQWTPIAVWPLTADVDGLVLWSPLLYLHGLNTRAKLYA